MKNKVLKECITIFIIVLFLGVLNYICLGFAKNGIDAPISYSGGDDFTQAMSIKTYIEKGWIGKNDLLGAPYDMTFYDFPTNFLMNVDNLNTFIFSRFTNNPFVVFNIQYIWTIMLCAIVAFIVLRCLKINRIFAILGSILYGMSPYIYSRGMGHFCLGACEFIPLSILLCVWGMEDDEQYLSMVGGIKSFFSNKKNIGMLICSLLIANNGMGYYPFFTCFFLCIVTIINVFRTKKVACIKKTVLPICCIVLFMLLALIPVFIYKIINGSNNIASRSISDLEYYGLKVMQFFVPTNNHHIGIVKKAVSAYNAQAPLVNENFTSYLGVFACAGFLISLIISFIPIKKQREMNIIKLFSKLSIWAILFFSIGGFVVLFCFLTGLRSFRGFNRVSIFIEFMGIATLCLCLQKLFELEWLKKRYILFRVCQIAIAGFALFCIWEQHPDMTENNNARAFSKSLKKNDIDFVSQIESMLQENDAVFQLPYHKYPEGGAVNNMSNYHLLAGYLNSSKLRWSYGGIKGRESDKWNEKVSALPTEKMINAIVQSGFRGIYIDSRAYTEGELQELCTRIEFALQNQKPVVSENRTLYFYNLYDYVEKHPELINLPIYE